MKTSLHMLALALVVFSLTFLPVAFGAEPEVQPPPPEGGGGGGGVCTYCSQQRCGCAAPSAGCTLSASCSCGSGKCTVTCNFTCE